MMDYIRGHGSTALRLVLLGAGTVAGVSCGDDPVSRPTHGTIFVEATTTGTDFDTDGYTVSVNNGAAGAVGNFGTLYVDDLEAGTYQVGLSGLATNCSIPSTENPKTVVVLPADTVAAEFAIACDVPEGPGGGGPPP